MAKYVNITADDTIMDTTKVTTGLFTGGIGTVAGDDLTTASLASSQTKYYYTLQKSSEDQFSIAYGHKAGSGSVSEGNNAFGETRAIYKQFASLLLPYDEVEGGFIVNDTSQSDMYFISFERARMKDRVNRKNWTLTLSGSLKASWARIKLTDNSKNSASVSSPVGPRYDVISGSLGNTAANTKYGYFYPNVGVLALSQQQLSASLPGTGGYLQSGSKIGKSNGHVKGVGFGRDTGVGTGAADNAGKMVNSILLGVDAQQGGLTFRSEEDQTSVSYFCRAKARDFNFSNNPTFSSGSDNGFSNTDFEGNPQSFITTVGLYNSGDNLVAVGRLSTPVKKNYTTEATIKVNLTY